jgi:hypothetical protein
MAEAHRQGLLAKVDEFGGMIVAHHREVVRWSGAGTGQW